MTRRLATLLLAALAVACVAAPLAHAGRSQLTSFEAPRDLLDPDQQSTAFSDIASFGVHSLRIVLYWKSVAPNPTSSAKPTFDQTDPANYDWGQYDTAIAEAKKRGWDVVLTVTGPVPVWATLARRDDRTRPSPTYFRRFMAAIAKHYGDSVGTFSIWNEPNHPKFLLPQYFKHQIASPAIYRKLWLAGYKGLQDGGIDKPQVLLGETAPIGNSYGPAPLAFLRGVLCLNSKYHRTGSGCSRLPIAGYAHHAYTTKAGPFFVPPKKDDVTIGVIGRLVSALKKAAAAKAIPSHTPIYLTEFGIQSKPDPLYGVSQQTQAEYQAISERLAYDQPTVKWFSQYLLRDDLPTEGADGEKAYGGFESGLETAGGKKKLSFKSFPVPLAALQTSKTRVSLWGLARPAHGRTSVTVYAGTKSFKKYATYETDSRGYFTKSVPFVKGRRYRLRWEAPDGTVYEGPPIRVHSRPKSS